MSALPTFVVIGAMKAGTTSLHAYLDGHPDVFMARPKELDFFVTERNWSRGEAWYRSMFAGATTESAVGEASPVYSIAPVFDGVPQRMASVIPGAKLIYVVRDPIRRLESMYLHSLVSGYERRPIEQAMAEDPVYLASARYASQLRQFLEHFPADQVQVLTAESLDHDREATVAAVYRFIGVDDTVRPASIASELHRTAGKRRPRRSRLARAAMSERGPVRRLPPALRRAVTAAASTPITRDDAVISPELRARILDELHDDIEGIRPFIGTVADRWVSATEAS